MAVIEIPYKPRNWARAMHVSWTRWFACVLHRRAGKTTAWLNHHQRAAVDDDWERERLRRTGAGFSPAEIEELLRVRVYAHILPTLTQARAVAWEPLKYFSRVIPGNKPNERDMSITYPAADGQLRVVRLWGADNIDGLRGIALSGLSLDEFSQHPPGVFGEVLSKCLADHLGYCAFLGTIKGKNQLYQTYQAAKEDADWFSLWQNVDESLRSETGATITALVRAMEDDRKLVLTGVMSQAEFDQEWYLSPHASIKGAYYAKQLAAMYREGRVRVVPYDPALPVHDVWDLGKGPKMSVGMFQRYGRQMQMIDYEEGQESDGIPQLVHTLQQKPYVWGRHFAPHDIKATDLSTGKTRLETAKALHWEFEVVPDIGVDDGIAAARMLLARTWVDETKCGVFLEALGQYRREWKEATGQFGDKPVHDWASHPTDMFRYAAVSEDKMINARPKPEVKRPVVKPRFTGRSGRDAGGLGWMG